MLRRDEIQELTINFRPHTSEIFVKEFVLLCDNLRVYPFKLIGEGCEVSLTLTKFQSAAKAW